MCPTPEVTAISFLDDDLDAAQLGGYTSWTAPAEVSKVTAYQAGLSLNLEDRHCLYYVYI